MESQKKSPRYFTRAPRLEPAESSANSALSVAVRTFRYYILHDQGKPGSRGYSLWLVVHWLKSRLPEATVILRHYQESVKMIFPRFYDRPLSQQELRPIVADPKKDQVRFSAQSNQRKLAGLQPLSAKK